MTKREFERLFDAALQSAARNAEDQLGRRIPRTFRVCLHGAGHSGDMVEPGAAIHDLYLGTDRFYRIIDVAVIEVGKGHTTVFVRASDHKPASFEQTWNDPPGSGPFKQLIADSIKVSEN